MADVADDGLVLHATHVLGGDDVPATGGRDEDVGLVDDPLQGVHLVALHDGLEGADGVHLGDDHAGALAPQRLGAALAHVAEAADHGCLPTDHHVGAPVDAVDERVPDAVEVVELGLGDRIVDVDGREQQLARLQHLVEPVDSGGRLLGDAPDAGRDPGPALGIILQRGTQRGQHHQPLLRVIVGRSGDDTGRLVLGTLVDQHRGVATVVQDEVGSSTTGPLQDLPGGPPVVLERLALPCEDRHAPQVVRGSVRAADDGGGGMVLGGEDVAAGPTHLGSEDGQGLDQHRRLDGHVERAADPGSGQRLLVGELGPQGHQAGHLMFGQADLVAAELVEGDVGDTVVVYEGQRPLLGRGSRRT